jgi:uncharacterized membrane protein YhhN
LLLALTAAFAVGDWVAVHSRRKALEYLCKPATMVALIGAVLAFDPADADPRPYIVAALALSLVGDVLLMLPDRDTLFVAGLGSFLLGHVAYVAAFVVDGQHVAGVLAGLVAVSIALGVLSPRIVGGVRRHDGGMAPPVQAYMAVISAMVVTAAGTHEVLAVLGAGSFYASDALIAWNRFVHEQRRGRIAIIVTYHVAQVLLALSLLT